MSTTMSLKSVASRLAPALVKPRLFNVTKGFVKDFQGKIQRNAAAQGPVQEVAASALTH